MLRLYLHKIISTTLYRQFWAYTKRN